MPLRVGKLCAAALGCQYGGAKQSLGSRHVGFATLCCPTRRSDEVTLPRAVAGLAAEKQVLRRAGLGHCGAPAEPRRESVSWGGTGGRGGRGKGGGLPPPPLPFFHDSGFLGFSFLGNVQKWRSFNGHQLVPSMWGNPVIPELEWVDVAFVG